MSAASGALSKPSDVWKVFNPALCRNEEMPRLLVLRECIHVDSRDAGHGPGRAVGGSGKDRERESEDDMYSMFKRGTFDIGAIDYRGQ